MGPSLNFLIDGNTNKIIIMPIGINAEFWTLQPNSALISEYTSKEPVSIIKKCPYPYLNVQLDLQTINQTSRLYF